MVDCSKLANEQDKVGQLRVSLRLEARPVEGRARKLDGRVTIQKGDEGIAIKPCSQNAAGEDRIEPVLTGLPSRDYIHGDPWNRTWDLRKS